jgi:lipopolysaccharide biosynthesis protein
MNNDEATTHVTAMYLPQFHQIPENDEWWGEGFTEWTNVRRAKPLFRGHRQPVVPGELGYYDLTDPSVRERQAALAREYGVDSFCYWHYWFSGRRLLERPFDEVLAQRTPTLPFFLGWANQSWSGVWHGAPNRILMAQRYPEGDEIAHFAELQRAFVDDRYVKFNGKPLLLIFSPLDLPNQREFVARYQALAQQAGWPGLYLVAWLEGRDWGVNYTTHHADGFDAGLYVHFPFQRNARAKLRERERTKDERFGPTRYPFAKHLPTEQTPLDGIVHRSVQPNWDNTPRSNRRGAVALGSQPAKFERHMREALMIERANPEGQRLVAIKSWNEWAEGNYVEPDEVHGRGWLDAIRRARGLA